MLIPLLPFVGFLVNAAFGRRLPKAVSGASRPARWGCRSASSVDGGVAAARQRAGRRRARDRRDAVHLDRVGRLNVPLAFRLDPLSAVMMLVITGIGTLIHLLLDGLHARRVGRRVRALLLVPEPVRRVHARAGARRELPGDVHRLGGRRALLVSADRLLVHEAVGRRRRQEGVHRQPRRRLRVHPRHARDLRDVRHAGLPGRRARASPRLPPEATFGIADAASRCCCSSARRASRRRFRSTSGCRTPWKARRRSRR